MEPLSIAVASLSLAQVSARTTAGIAGFVRTVRSARQDLLETSRHLGELSGTLDLLRGDDTDQLPKGLQFQIQSILDNCGNILHEIDGVLDKYRNGAGATRWALSGKGEIERLNKQLDTHLRSLNIAVEATTLALSQSIKDDTGAMRDDVARILDEIANLRLELQASTRSIPQNEDNDNAKGQDYLIKRYLDTMTTYAETVVDVESVCGENDHLADTRTLSEAESVTIAGSEHGTEEPSRNASISTMSSHTWTTGEAKRTTADSTKITSLSSSTVSSPRSTLGGMKGSTPETIVSKTPPGSTVFSKTMTKHPKGVKEHFVTVSPNCKFVVIQNCRDGDKVAGFWYTAIYSLDEGQWLKEFGFDDGLPVWRIRWPDNERFLMLEQRMDIVILSCSTWETTSHIALPPFGDPKDAGTGLYIVSTSTFVALRGHKLFIYKLDSDGVATFNRTLNFWNDEILSKQPELWMQGDLIVDIKSGRYLTAAYRGGHTPSLQLAEARSEAKELSTRLYDSAMPNNRGLHSYDGQAITYNWHWAGRPVLQCVAVTTGKVLWQRDPFEAAPYNPEMHTYVLNAKIINRVHLVLLETIDADDLLKIELVTLSEPGKSKCLFRLVRKGEQLCRNYGDISHDGRMVWLGLETSTGEIKGEAFKVELVDNWDELA
ncbi:hypothetical protein OQA88_5446 [Cercophora sp. LCS_1]